MSLDVLSCLGDQGSYVRFIAPFGKTVWTVNGKGIQTFTSELFWKQEIDKVHTSLLDLSEIFFSVGGREACL